MCPTCYSVFALTCTAKVLLSDRALSIQQRQPIRTQLRVKLVLVIPVLSANARKLVYDRAVFTTVYNPIKLQTWCRREATLTVVTAGGATHDTSPSGRDVVAKPYRRLHGATRASPCQRRPNRWRRSGSHWSHRRYDGCRCHDV